MTTRSELSTKVGIVSRSFIPLSVDKGLRSEQRAVEIFDPAPIEISPVKPPDRRGAESAISAADIGKAKRPLRREQLIRQVALLTFCDLAPSQNLLLTQLSKREWRKLLKWLDISGLALYFFDRIEELQMCELLPTEVITRLRRNLLDNTRRTAGMIAESLAIQQDLQKANVSYAIIKGLSLGPPSVARPELRHQFDLDFLIAEKCIQDARSILEERGYRLYTISGRTWEFKKNERPGVPLSEFYKDLPGRSVELHVDAGRSGRLPILDRTEWRELYGMSAPILPAVYQFIGQGMHAYKDICSEFLRVSHLLEFRRHASARSTDGVFWDELRIVVQDDPSVILGLGVATQLITRVMGPFAPEKFTCWTVSCLPASVLSWIDVYGPRVVFRKFPGDKLHLVLRKELEGVGIPDERQLWSRIIPLHLPPTLVKPIAHESISLRARRYRLQLHQIVSRLRFHIVEGLRYAQEARRWQQHKNRVRPR